MTNRQRVLAVLKGDIPDRVLFTSYDWKFPLGFDKRKLRERGLVMVNRHPGYKAGIGGKNENRNKGDFSGSSAGESIPVRNYRGYPAGLLAQKLERHT